MKKHFAPPIPPRSIVLTWSDREGAFVVCGFSRNGGRPVIQVSGSWLSLLQEGSTRAGEVGCEFFVSDVAVTHILEPA